MVHNFLFFCKNNKGDYMAKTGMTRRIDELGRLVIPKEIRKNLKIKDNDQVEITVIDNKIILNKFYNLNKDRVISILIKCLRKIINKNVLFTSKDEIIDYSLMSKETLNNKELNEVMVNMIENRKDVINYVHNKLIYSIYPLIINGDLYGSIITYGNNDINDDLNVINFGKKFLENYLE